MLTHCYDSSPLMMVFPKSFLLISVRKKQIKSSIIDMLLEVSLHESESSETIYFNISCDTTHTERS